MKKYQSLITEYILILLLSISILGYTLVWFNNNKALFSNFLAKNQIENSIQVIDNFLYNFEGIKYAKQNIIISGITGLCVGNFTLLQTNIICQSSPKNIAFQGYVININGSLFIYSNKTKVYYPMVPIGFYTYKSCYNSVITYIINTTKCALACRGNCDIYLIKNDSIIEIK